MYIRTSINILVLVMYTNCTMRSETGSIVSCMYIVDSRMVLRLLSVRSVLVSQTCRMSAAPQGGWKVSLPSPDLLKGREVSIPVPWGVIAGREWGSPAGLPWIALHGWLDNAGTFDTLAPLFPAQHRYAGTGMA